MIPLVSMIMETNPVRMHNFIVTSRLERQESFVPGFLLQQYFIDHVYHSVEEGSMHL